MENGINLLTQKNRIDVAGLQSISIQAQTCDALDSFSIDPPPPSLIK